MKIVVVVVVVVAFFVSPCKASYMNELPLSSMKELFLCIKRSSQLLTCCSQKFYLLPIKGGLNCWDKTIFYTGQVQLSFLSNMSAVYDWLHQI